MLILVDFNVNLQDINRKTVLHKIICHASDRLFYDIDQLLDIGADCNIVDKFG